MTYRGIDRKRFAYLLSLGTDESELKRFFTDCRLQLIQRRGKVQNLPHGSKARIQTLASELPPLTDEVVQSWFAKHVTMVDPEEAEAVVGVLERYEELGEELPEDSARKFARSCLVHLFAKVPSQSLIDFLKSPIGGHTKRQEDAAEIAHDQHEVPPVAAYPWSLPQVLVDLVEGRDADEHLGDLPPELATFVSGLQAGWQGQMAEARQAIDALPADSVLRSRLEQFLRQEEVRKACKEDLPRGLLIADLETFEGSFDYERDEVLGYCTNADRTTAVFVRPIAVVRGGRIQHLTEAKRDVLFPETGDVIAFTGAGHPRQPRRGEIGIWRVAEHETDKATRFHLASERRTVYEVRSVPFPSTDYDSVREFLKEHADRPAGGSLQPLLFQLNDWLIVGGRGERPNLSRDDSFESGLLSWNSLSALRFEGRLFVPGPLPKEQGIYDCASLASTVRKLFKAHVGGERTPVGLTRSQLSDLAHSLASVEAGLDALRVQRIKAELEKLGEQQEAFDALLDELLNHSSIKQRIEQLVEQKAEEQIEQKRDLEADILRLKNDRAEWEKRILKQRNEYKKLLDGISKAVKARFERAREDGLATLAEIAVFQALSAPPQSPLTVSENRSYRSLGLAQPTVRNLVPSRRDAVTILKALGVPAQRATAFALTCEAAHQAGLMVCVSGVAARLAVDGWAKALMQRGVLIDSSVGLIDDSAMRDVLAAVPTPDGLALLDANLSALDIYARPLSDLVFTRLAESAIGHEPAVLLALADGVGALPLPRTFERISVSVDLDTRYVFRGVSDLEDLMSEVAGPDDGTMYARLWRPAADRLRTQIDQFEPEEQALILSVLASQAFSLRQQ